MLNPTTALDNDERDDEIVAAYQKGETASKIARDMKLSISRVRAILSSRNAVKGPAMPKSQLDKVVDPAHQRIGNRLYAYRFRKMHDVQRGAEFLGWSVKKLRGVELGSSVLNLQELQDISKYMDISLSDLMKDI